MINELRLLLPLEACVIAAVFVYEIKKSNWVAAINSVAILGIFLPFGIEVYRGNLGHCASALLLYAALLSSIQPTVKELLAFASARKWTAFVCLLIFESALLAVGFVITWQCNFGK